MIRSLAVVALLGFGCDRPTQRSAWAAEEQAIQKARLYCQTNSVDLNWLREPIRALEKAPFAQQQYLLVFRSAQGTLFATGPGPVLQKSGAWVDCQGKAVTQPLALERHLVGSVIYAPPIHRRSLRR